VSTINRDSEVLLKGRKNTLKNVEGIEAPLRDQIPEKLARRLEDMDFTDRLREAWTQGNNNRTEWLVRQESFVNEFDEFIRPIYSATTDWSSVLHMPTTFTVCKTYHARMLAALLGVDPSFTVKARRGSNTDRAMLVQELLRYTLKYWINRNDGIEDTVDRWLWDWITTGVGILKSRWAKEYTRFVDVEDTEVPAGAEVMTDPSTGEDVVVPVFRTEQREVNRTEKIFDGPMLERVSVEDLLIVGGEGDPQKADFVMQQNYMTASDLWTLADRKIFRKEAVEEVIKSGENLLSSEQNNNLKISRRMKSGQLDLDVEQDLDRYQIIEAYARADVDGSGINSDIIVWFHKETGALLRATYLHRVMPSGLRPFTKIDFHKRPGQEYGAGMVELMYSLSKEIDAIHNIRIDTGILTSMPFGFYRPTSSMSEEKLPVEPGALVPVDNPSTDVFIPNWGNRTAFGFQEESALMSAVERLTSISSISLGVIGGQGATRTATGTRAVVGESNANLDVFLRRMNKGWSQVLKYLFHLMQQNIEPGFQFRVLGDTGDDYWAQIESREELRGMYDFELESNSANSNRAIQQQVADFVLQLTSNPIDLQLGIVTPRERYEALKNAMKVRGIKEVSRYIREPQNLIKFTPMEILNRAVDGVDVRLSPDMDLAGIVELAQEFLSNDELLGQLTEQQAASVMGLMQEAQQLMAAIQQQQAQVANTQQQQINSQQGTLQGEAAPNAQSSTAEES
jgi:hypothetical protein